MIKCREKTTDCLYAGKVVRVGGKVREEVRQRAERELDLLRELVHPRVVTLVDAFNNEDRIVLVME